MYQPNLIEQTLIDHCQQLKQAGWRSILLLEGDAQWRQAWVAKLIQTMQWSNGLHTAELTQHLQKYLGQEFQFVHIDSQDGLSADKIAALSGTIIPGGLLIISLDERVLAGDSALRQALPWHAQDVSIYSYFNQRLIKTIKQSAGNIYYRQNSSLTCNALPLPESGFSYPTSWTKAQNQLIEQSLILSQGVLTITADRGRGKSAALGEIARRHLNRHQAIVLVAPAKRCLTIFYQWLGERCQQLLTFLPPDLAVVTEAPEDAVLIVDEAAAMPAPLLKQLIKKYHKAILATTVQGYEGSGRGFAKHFLTELDEAKAPHLNIQLDQPIRWAIHDPLEHWVQDTLLMQKKPNKQALSIAATGDCVTGPDEQCYQIAWLDKKQLAKDPHPYFYLLSQAHYRTKPEDLKYLLDSPFLKLAALYQNQHLCAVCLISLEGGLPEELALACSQGTRRPNGHLTSQIIAAQMGDIEFAKLKGWRIVRIAVANARQNSGLGSLLLNWLTTQAKQQQVAYISASYSASIGVCHFWLKNQFINIRLSHTAEHHSGFYSLLSIKAIEMAPAHVNQLSIQGMTHLLYQISDYQQLSAEQIWHWLAGFISPPLSANEINLANGFSQYATNWQAAKLSIFKQCLEHAKTLIKHQDKQMLAVLTALLIKHKPLPEVAKTHGFAGQKALIKWLRARLKEIFTESR
ncbi:GNAT family N-acetyltransferase [Gayadomonas joobiniege]|uniref:GNAT family N-acetyltransferase n=1 Tax=Gayadomonas joobiniege TaxID=1234606 RepID=UPI0003800A40|nr:GNAT family N-acetyltransferase [Gayadomonas joobiniege]